MSRASRNLQPGNANVALIELLGVTLAGPQSNEFDGAYDNGQLFHGSAYAYYNFENDVSESAAWANFDNAPIFPWIGVFLVRPVPEPGTGLLVGFGLVTIGARSRHRRKCNGSRRVLARLFVVLERENCRPIVFHAHHVPLP